jgi:arylsulfatase A-like enzyme
MKYLLVFWVAVVTCAHVAAAQKPNVIYILADDLAYDELGCYGQKKIKTPNIDRIAHEGIRFTRHYSGAPVCAPSRFTLMTGKHIGRSKSPGQSQSLADDEITLGKVMKKAGYRTGAFGKWGLGENPVKRGFDEWLGFLDQRRAHFFYPEWIWVNDQKLELPNNKGLRKDGAYARDENFKNGTYIHDLFTDAALKFIEESKDQPFFLYLPYTIPHAEFVAPDDSMKQYDGLWDETPHKTVLGPPEKGKGRWEGGFPFYDGYGYCSVEKPNATYAAMVSRMDRDIGRIMNLIKTLGLDENTLIMFSSDNGPTHIKGYNREFFAVPEVFKFKGHKGSINDGGIRAPFVARWPGKIQPQTVTDTISYFPDILPTLAELAGVTVEEKIDGQSLMPVLLGEADKWQDHEYLFWQKNTLCAIRMGDYKGFVNGDQLTEVYNLDTDVGETENIIKEAPQAIRDRMLQIANDVKVNVPPRNKK